MDDPLKHVTYMVIHNPTCPSSYMVRTCGTSHQVHPQDRRNFVSYGRSFEQAARAALVLIDDHERSQRVHRHDRAFAGIVWG